MVLIGEPGQTWRGSKNRKIMKTPDHDHPDNRARGGGVDSESVRLPRPIDIATVAIEGGEPLVVMGQGQVCGQPTLVAGQCYPRLRPPGEFLVAQ